MIVADEHEVDGWKILPGYSRFAMAPGTHPSHGTRSFGPDGIGQDVATSLLKEHGGVIHQRDAQRVVLNPAWRHRQLNVVDESGRWFGAAGELPTEDLEKTPRLRSVGIVIAPSVKVFGNLQAAVPLSGDRFIFASISIVASD